MSSCELFFNDDGDVVYVGGYDRAILEHVKRLTNRTWCPDGSEFHDGPHWLMRGVTQDQLNELYDLCRDRYDEVTSEEM